MNGKVDLETNYSIMSILELPLSPVNHSEKPISEAQKMKLIHNHGVENPTCLNYSEASALLRKLSFREKKHWATHTQLVSGAKVGLNLRGVRKKDAYKLIMRKTQGLEVDPKFLLDPYNP